MYYGDHDVTAAIVVFWGAIIALLVIGFVFWKTDMLRQAGNSPGDGGKKRWLGHFQKDTLFLWVLQDYKVP